MRREILKSLLQHTPHLKKFLPEGELDNVPDIGEIHAAYFTEPAVHWSWMLPIIKNYTEEEQALFVASYDEGQLAKILKVTPPKHLSPIAKAFFRKTLFEKLGDARPAQYVPKNDLSKLLDLSKKELVALIDKLALYDLAEEVRQIVETKILKTLYSLISEADKQTLKRLSVKKEQLSLGRLHLDRWDGTEEMLKSLLHKRGLLRLSVALGGLDPAFLWHIAHRLDVGRGERLLKICDTEKSSVRDVVVRQILDNL